jgi:hypothetical protein
MRGVYRRHVTIQAFGLAAVDVQDNHLSGSSGAVYRSGTNINATPIARRNTGYNPVGKFATQPAVPSGGSQYLNTLGGDATVFVSAGTAANGVTVEGRERSYGLDHTKEHASLHSRARWAIGNACVEWCWHGADVAMARGLRNRRCAR